MPKQPGTFELPFHKLRRSSRARSREIRQLHFFKIHSSDLTRFWRGRIGKQSQCIQHDDNRRPLVDKHGEAEAGPAEKCCRDQQGDRTKRDKQVLADDRSRHAAKPDGEREFAKLVAHQYDVRGFQCHVGAGATHGDADRGAGESGRHRPP